MGIVNIIKDVIAGGGIVGKIIDKVAADKMDAGQKAQLELEFIKETNRALEAEENNFRNFVLEYEGQAKDMPRSIQIVRSLVRPVITAVGFFGYIGVKAYLIMYAQTADPAMHEALTELYYLNWITLPFWFGDKFLQRTDLIGKIMNGKNKE